MLVYVRECHSDITSLSLMYVNIPSAVLTVSLTVSVALLLFYLIHEINQIHVSCQIREKLASSSITGLTAYLPV